jgi:hypothetical protein
MVSLFSCTRGLDQLEAAGLIAGSAGQCRLLLYHPRHRGFAQAQGHPPDRSTAPPQRREICHGAMVILRAWPTTDASLRFGTLKAG